MRVSLLVGALMIGVAQVGALEAEEFHSSFAEGIYDASRFSVTVEKLAEGVFVMRRPASWRSFVQANITVIINDEDVVVVDSGSTTYTENVVKEIKKLTGKPVSTVVTTHWHGDHNRGNHVYRKHFPNVEIISHAKTHENMWHRDKSLAEPQDPDGRKKQRDYIAGLIEKGKTEGRPAELMANYRDYQAGIDELYEEQGLAQSGIADITFEDKMVLHRGRRQIELLHLGRANTDGDIVVWLPKEQIVAVGDIVVRPTPYGFFSYPAEWADTINNIKALGFNKLVPGHGPVMADASYLDKLINLFRDLTTQTEAAVAAGADSVDAVREAVDFSAHDAAIAGDDPLFRHLFNIWFKNPILDSAYKEAKGLPIPQYEAEE